MYTVLLSACLVEKNVSNSKRKCENSMSLCRFLIKETLQSSFDILPKPFTKQNLEDQFVLLIGLLVLNRYFTTLKLMGTRPM